MRPWRDIVSTDAWNHVVANSESTAKISKVKSLQAKFDSSVDTPTRSLRKLGEMIATYHDVPKTDLKSLGKRIAHLSCIIDAAESHLMRFSVDLDKAKERVVMRQVINTKTNGSSMVATPLKKDATTGHYMQGSAFDQSIDRTLLTLQNRGFRKAEYLSQLQKYYANHSQDPKALIAQLTAPQQKGADWTGLAPGVRMEQLDPWHRPVEVQFDNGKLKESDELQDMYSASVAFAQWFHSVPQHNLPFFLWLEGHPICLSDDKDQVAGTRSVQYVKGAEGAAMAGAAHRLCLVYPHGGLLWMDELKPGGYTRKASTDGYTCSSGKGVSDAAAYVWTGREIIIAQHQESSFHHSSFTSGGAVRCAGMIKMDGGRVTYISNNSGHYKPDKGLLRNMVSYLQNLGVLAPTCKVQCQGLKFQGKNRDYVEPAGVFLAQWHTL